MNMEVSRDSRKMQLFIITIWDRAKTLDTALHVEHADGTKFRLPCSISESDPKNKKKNLPTYTVVPTLNWRKNLQ